MPINRNADTVDTRFCVPHSHPSVPIMIGHPQLLAAGGSPHEHLIHDCHPRVELIKY